MTHPNRRRSFLQISTSACALLLLSAVTLLSGCGSFFSCEGKSECPSGGGGTGTNTGDYVYVTNSTTGATYLNGYAPAASTLAATTSSPYSLTYLPSAIAITPTNSYMYIASDASDGQVYAYTIGDDGALTVLNNLQSFLSENVAAMDVSPDGQWLFVMDASPAQQVNVYPIDTTTGVLGKLAANIPLTLAPAAGGNYTPFSVKVAPSGDFVVCTLGIGGADIFAFDTTNATYQTPTQLIPGTNTTGIYAAAFDANNYLYTAGTAGLQTFSLNSAGAATQVGSTYATGAGARSIVVNSTSTDVYIGNYTDGTITGYTIGTNAALTAIAGSPFSGPTQVSSLAINSTGAFLVAAGINTSTGLQLYSIGTTGALTSDATTGTGTAAPVTAIGATH